MGKWDTDLIWDTGVIWSGKTPSQAFISETDALTRRASIRIVIGALEEFVINSLRLNIDAGRSLQEFTHNTLVDRTTFSQLTVKLQVTTTGEFVLYYMTPTLNIKHKQPIG